MMTKRELQIQADDLIKNNSKNEAMAIYRKLWDEYPQNEPDNFNSYDAVLTLKATMYSKDEICEDFKSKFSNLRNNL